jgi:hypothetical protein
MRSFFLGVLAVFTASAANCDHACRAGLITRYLGAMVAHNPAALPLDGSVRFTENCQQIRLAFMRVMPAGAGWGWD